MKIKMQLLILLFGLAAPTIVVSVVIREDPGFNMEEPIYFPLHRAVETATKKGSNERGLLSFSEQGAYYTPVHVEGQTFNLVIDTGSSDTWIASKDVQCQAYGIHRPLPLPQSDCAFGSLYKPGKGFKRISNINYDSYYGDLRAVDGYFGKVDVTLGGITVNTQIGVVEHAAWQGQNTTSGYLGLAFPDLVFAQKGNKPLPPDEIFQNGTFAFSSTQVVYDPIFTSMWKQKLISAVFTITLNRPSSKIGNPDGYLSLGRSLPPVKTVGAWTKAALEYPPKSAYFFGVNPYPQYEYYVFTADDFLIQPAEQSLCQSKHLHHDQDDWETISRPANLSRIQIQPDTGADFIFIQDDIADSIAASYSPPATWNQTADRYDVLCNAKAPGFAVNIGAVILPIDKKDLIFKNPDGSCQTGVQRGGKDSAPYVWGDTFYQNVVAVHDIGKMEMRFASRGKY